MLSHLSYAKYKKIHPYLSKNKKKKKKKKKDGKKEKKKKISSSFEEETLKFIGELENGEMQSSKQQQTDNRQTKNTPTTTKKEKLSTEKKHIRSLSRDTSTTTVMTIESAPSTTVSEIALGADYTQTNDFEIESELSTSFNASPSTKSQSSSPKHAFDQNKSGKIKETNVFKKGKSNILVAVRVRPMLKKEREVQLKNIIKILNHKMVVVLDIFSKDDILRANRSREKKYAFDHAFDDTVDQNTVYRHTVKHLIGGVMNGYNATVFAYGATGSGKTHTMLGTDTEPGIMFLALRDIFQHIDENSDDLKYQVELSYLEVYNEMIRDLLEPSDEYLELREDATQGIHVVGITKKKVKNVKAVMTLLRAGNKNRTQEPTAANRTSSRSHAVLQVWVKHRERSANTRQEYTVGKLSLIDLAGSERASVTQNKGIRLLEGANINRSLLALGNCINALRKGSRGGYIPFRDSKLTRLLKDSLGGNCRTVMITAISPGHLTHEDTLNALKYADRAKHIKTNVTKNTYAVDKHIVHYTKIIEELRSEISNLKQKLVHRRRAKTPQTSNMITTPTSPTGATIDVIMFDKYKNKLEMNFEELLQSKTSLYELEELQMSNKIRCHELHLEISRGATAGYSHSKLKKLKRELHSILQSMRRNEKMKSNFRMKTLDLEKNALIVKEKLKLITKNDSAYQDLLSQLLKLHVLELQNTELLAYQNKQKDMLRSKDLELQKVKMQLELRDSLIRKQSSFIVNNDLIFEEPNEFGSLLDIEEIFPNSNSLDDSQDSEIADTATDMITPPPLNRSSTKPVFQRRFFEDNDSPPGSPPAKLPTKKRTNKLQRRRLIRQQRLASIYGSATKPKSKSKSPKRSKSPPNNSTPLRINSQLTNSPPIRSNSPPVLVEDVEASDKLRAARVARAQRRESLALRSNALDALKSEWKKRVNSSNMMSASFDSIPSSLPALSDK